MAKPSEQLGIALLHDRGIILAAGIRPKAIALRLAEMARGIDGYSTWCSFRVPGRGQSSQYNDSGQLKVVLEFAKSDDGAAVYAQLHELRPQFRAIAELTSSRCPPNGLVVSLIVREPA